MLGLALMLFGSSAVAAAPPEDASLEAARLDIERRRIRLEEARFELDRGERLRMEQQRLALDKEVAAGKRFQDFLASLVPALIALVTIPLTYVATRWNERRKVHEELAIANDQELRKERLATYKLLWEHLEPLALYAPKRMPYRELPEMSATLKGWYFKGGGMFMTKSTREHYFKIQHGLELIWERSKDVDHETLLEAPGLSPTDRKKDEARYGSFAAGDDELPGGVFATDAATTYRFLRALGSLLRTSMTADLGSRDP